MDEFKPKTQLESSLLARLQSRKAKSTYRELKSKPINAVDFSSNDFLSLSTSTLLRDAFLLELSAQSQDFTLGSGGSRLLDGNSKYADDLEKEIAKFHGAPAGLLWNSGFDANAGFFACVPQPGDIIVYDELIHASVHDGMKMSHAAKRLPFRHSCVAHLRSVLEELIANDAAIKFGHTNVFITVESVYSMDGDLAPLAEIVSVSESLFPFGNCHVTVDEAHATGVIGPLGRGLVNKLGLENRVFARLHTFGKSLACSGAILLCSPLVRSYLINYARPLIYTTFMPFPALATIRAAYGLLQQGTMETSMLKLRYLISHLHTGLSRMIGRCQRDSTPYDLLRISEVCPESPIFCILTDHPRSLAKFCQDVGFTVRAVVPPTVPTRRVRVCLHAGNTTGEIDKFVARIEQWVLQHTKLEGTKGPARTTLAQL